MDPLPPTRDPVALVHSYHAHIYYDPSHSRPLAERVRQDLARRFSVQLGRWHDVAIGPHKAPMYQVAFATEVFAALVPWLMLNRRGLSVLVHPNTLAPRDDHLLHALWLGAPLALIEAVLPVRADAPEPAVVPNTHPAPAG